MSTVYPLPPEPPLDPPDDEAEANARERLLRTLAEQAEEDYWYEKHGSDAF